MPIDLASGRFIEDDGTFSRTGAHTVDGPLAATNIAAAGTLTGTSASASALAVGRQGATSPALQVDASTASSVTGVKVKAGASGGGAAVSVVGGATDEALTVDAKGAGALTLNGTATGGITLARTATFSKPAVHTPSAVSALAIDVTASGVYTKSIAGDSTFTASAAGTAGQFLTLIITVDGTQRVATFGTNLNSSGTMTIPANKVGVIQFVSDGTAWREMGRSINT